MPFDDLEDLLEDNDDDNYLDQLLDPTENDVTESTSKPISKE